ncbi:hypothetical protein AB6A40_004529 [Gnathostoma spinigerum]|uniref:NAD(+) kinase n=1 Tax=Gnathostoma spinigerum TaxID=75299 RepID=A0ABD6ENG6_9BILA
MSRICDDPQTKESPSVKVCSLQKKIMDANEWNSQFFASLIKMVSSYSSFLTTITATARTLHKASEEVSSSKQSSVFLPARVLILSKMTKLEFIKSKCRSLTTNELKAFIRQRGMNYAELKKKDMHHQQYVEAMKDVLKSYGIESRCVGRDRYSDVAIAWADVIFSAGGDGTFLLAASKIKDHKPVIGFNTDHLRSEGHLCVTGKSNMPVRESIDRLLRGKFRWIWRQRIRVTFPKWIEEGIESSEAEEMSEKSPELKKARLFRNDSFDPSVPLLALNDVFIGESHAARVSSYDLQVDDGEMEHQKSSGLVVCTGTGSTSWHYNINRMSGRHISDILTVMKDMKICDRKVTAEMISEICHRQNEKLIFDPESLNLAYTVRDPVENSTYHLKHTRGFAEKIRVRSRGSNAHLIIDGSISVPFNYGTEVLLEISSGEPLRTVVFS